MSCSAAPLPWIGHFPRAQDAAALQLAGASELCRFGRSGRYGRKSVVISFVKEDEIRVLCDIEQFYSKQVRPCLHTFFTFPFINFARVRARARHADTSSSPDRRNAHECLRLNLRMGSAME